MRLRLSVTSEERAALGHRARHEFDASGGVIGRNANCTWSLPDATNTISARHAAISHNGRGFLITDTSTNGVYLNTVDAPIGRGAAAPLAHGDTLYLGHFVILVEVVDEAEDARRRVGASSAATPMIGGGEMGWPPPGAQSRPAAPAQLRSPTLYPPPPSGAGDLSDLLSPQSSVARSRAASRPPAPPPIPASTILPSDFASAPRAGTIPPTDFGPPPTSASSILPADFAPPPPAAPSPPARIPPTDFASLAPPLTSASTIPPADFAPAPRPATVQSAPPPPAPTPSATILPADFALTPSAAAPSIERGAQPMSPAALPPLGGGTSSGVDAASRRSAIPADALPAAAPGAKAPNLPPTAGPSEAPSVAKAPLIPDVFDFSDLMRPKAAAAISPAPSSIASPPGPETPAAPLTASIPPAAASPSATLPLDFSDLSPAASAPPPKAPETATQTERAPLRATASLAPDAAPVLLDPVAVLRQRASDYSNAARQVPPEPPSLLPRAPVAAPIAPAEPAVPRMSLTTAASAPRAAAIPLAQPPGGARAAGSQNAAITALCEGLGLDPSEIPPHVLAQTLLELGRTLRVALDGMIPVLAARRSLKGEFHMDQTRLQPRENNPLKFLSSGDEVLRAALKPDASGFLSLSEALREGFNDIRAHEVAAIVALQGAVKSVLDRFDPSTLEGSGGGGGKLFGRGPDKAKLWDQFVARYAAIANDPDEAIRQIVGGEFARAYAQQTQAEAQGRP